MPSFNLFANSQSTSQLLIREEQRQRGRRAFLLFGTSRPLASFRRSSHLCWRRRHRTFPRRRWHYLQWGRRNQTGSSTSNSLAEYQQQRAEELSPARTRAVLMYVDVDGAEDIPMAETLDTPIIAREALADVASAACP